MLCRRLMSVSCQALSFFLYLLQISFIQALTLDEAFCKNATLMWCIKPAVKVFLSVAANASGCKTFVFLSVPAPGCRRTLDNALSTKSLPFPLPRGDGVFIKLATNAKQEIIKGLLGICLLLGSIVYWLKHPLFSIGPRCNWYLAEFWIFKITFQLNIIRI